MSDAEAELRALWDWFADYRSGLYSEFGTEPHVDLPDSDIKSAAQLIEIYDDLPASRQEDIAAYYHVAPDQFRKLLREGWDALARETKGPFGNAYANEYEKYFYQRTEPFIDQIRQAARNLGVQSEDTLIYGLLPTGEINARNILAPNGRGHVIAINVGTFFFLDSMGDLFGELLAALGPGLHETATREAIDDLIRVRLRHSIDEHMDRRFTDLVVSYFVTGLPGFAFTGPSPQEIMRDPFGGPLGTGFTDLVLPFVLSHEYAHSTTETKELDDALTQYHEQLFPDSGPEVARELERRRDALQEIAADKLGFDIFLELSLIKFGMPEPNSSRLIAALSNAYAGMSACLSCLEALENTQSLSRAATDGQPDTHPPMAARRAWLGNRFIGDLSGKGYPMYQITFNGRIAEEFCAELWNRNKTRIGQLIRN